MLSLMRKHAQSWMIKGILFLIVIVFAFWGVGSFRSDRATRLAKVNGKTISVMEFQQAYRQTLDRMKEFYGQQMDDKSFYSKEFKRKVLDSLIEKDLVLEAAKSLGFSVSSDDLDRAIQQMPYFQENGKFNPIKYKRVLQMSRTTPETFEADQRVALLQERVVSFLNGLVKIEPEEVKNFYSFLNNEVNDYVIWFKEKDYQNRVEVTKDQLKAYFTQNQVRYQTPVQIRLAYINTNPKDFEDKAVVSEKDVQEYYQQNQKKFLDAKTNKTQPLDQVQEQIRKLLKSGKAYDLARQKAEEVYDQVLTKGNLMTFSREFKTPVKETEWLTYGEKREGLEGVAEFYQKAFSLKKGELAPIQDLGPEWGFVILQVIDRRESHTMSFEQAESRVKEDLINEKAVQIAHSEAEAFLKELRQKKDIHQIAREKGRTVEETGFFSRVKNRPSWVETPEIQEQLFSLGPVNPLIEKPIKLGTDYVLLVYKESRPANMEDFEKDKDRIYQALQQQKQKAIYDQWTRLLREKAKITINPDLL